MAAMRHHGRTGLCYTRKNKLKRDPEKHGGDNPEKKERAKQKQAWTCKTGEWIALFIEHTAIGQACQIMSDKVSNGPR
jgi:hypothetical protein